MLEEIKPLVGLGFSLHWLRPKSKIPIESGWTKTNTKSLLELKSSYTPGLNVGVRPGAPSKLKDGTFLCIIDCDMKSEEKSHRKELEKALDTLMPNWEFSPKVISGRNKYSMHIYAKTKEPLKRFQMAESAHRVKAKMPSKQPTAQDENVLTPDEIKAGWRMARAWEITFMSSGSQVVLPPSIHPDSGREYSWEIPVKDAGDLTLYSPPSAKPALSSVGAGTKFRFIEWSKAGLKKAGVSEKFIKLITSGEGLDLYNNDRSSALFAVINALSGLPDDLVISVLTDSANAISEKALEKFAGSRAKAARWTLSQIGKVKREKDAKFEFQVLNEVDEVELDQDQIEEQQEELITWTSQLDRTQHGSYKNTSKNRLMIIENEVMPEGLSYNEFNHQIIYKYEPPWKEANEETYLERELSNVDLTRVKVWLQTKYSIDPSEDEIFKILDLFSRRYTYHPIKDYLESLTWDGRHRLDEWLINYCGAEGPETYLRAVARKTLVACVSRIYNPGCKFDYVPIFEGAGGIGKSSAVKILGDPWCPNGYVDPTNKDVISVMQGAWIIELDELTQMDRASTEAMKAFITKTEDRARLAYAKKAETFKRHCVFIGTTNKNQYLQDETGNRRFWPVRMTALKRLELVRDRDQLWAEAVQEYKAGETLYLSKELEDMATLQQRARYDADEWTHSILEFIDKGKKDFVTTKEVYAHIMGVDDPELVSVKDLTTAIDRRIGKNLRFHGFESVRAREKGKQFRGWGKISAKGRISDGK